MPQRPPVHRPQGWQPAAELRADFDRRRGTATARGYDAAWRQLRARYLRANPLCAFCARDGRDTPATQVDHVETVAERPDRRLDWSNLRSLCDTHHSRRTADYLRGRRY